MILVSAEGAHLNKGLGRLVTRGREGGKAGRDFGRLEERQAGQHAGCHSIKGAAAGLEATGLESPQRQRQALRRHSARQSGNCHIQGSQHIPPAAMLNLSNMTCQRLPRLDTVKQ